jgi:20S proteasome alpha/beta subunit
VSLLVCLAGQDGIVAATDSRGTFGDPRGVTAQNDSQKKLYLVSNHTAILVAGSGELGAMLLDEVQKQIQGRKGASEIMELVRAQVKAKYNDWFARFAVQPLPSFPAPLRPDVTIIVAGYDPDESNTPKTQRLYQLISQLDFAPMLHNYGFALGGIGQYALYLLNRLYEKEKTVEQLKALAAYVITETASQDGKVGGPVQMAVLTPSGSKELTESETGTIIASNHERAKQLKDSFFRKV